MFVRTVVVLQAAFLLPPPNQAPFLQETHTGLLQDKVTAHHTNSISD